MALGGRVGLASITSTGSGGIPAAADWNALQRHLVAVGTLLREVYGGEGIITGGARAVGDLASSGASYPACTMILNDDSGYPWAFRLTSATAITFIDSAATGTNGHLYAVIKTTTSGGASLADGSLTDVTFAAYDSTVGGFTAPAHSLLIGTGAFSSGAFTTFTGEGFCAGVKLLVKTDTGDPTGAEGLVYVNTYDNAVRVYADAAWRTLLSW